MNLSSPGFCDRGRNMFVQSVLVVEDSVLIARLIEALLSSADIKVMLTGGVEEIWEALKQSRPDLILLDMQLPGLSGLSAVRRLKSDSATKSIPIAVLTDHGSPVDRQDMLAAGCEGFICKPLDPVDFIAQVVAFLSRAAPVPAADDEFQTQRAETTFRLRKAFLSEGAMDARVLVESLEQGAHNPDFVDAILHRWVGCGDAAGIPEISAGAQRTRILLAGDAPERSALLEEAHALRNLFDDAYAEYIALSPQAALGAG